MSSQIPRYECGPFLKRAHLPKIVCDFTGRSLWYNFFQWDLSFHFRKPIPPTDAFLVCSVFKIESPLTLTRVLMGLQSTVIYRTCTLNTYCKFSISISRGVEKKKIPPSVSHRAINTSIIHLAPVASLRITLRTHWSCDYFCDNQGYFLMGTLNSSQTVCDVFAEVDWKCILAWSLLFTRMFKISWDHLIL